MHLDIASLAFAEIESVVCFNMTLSESTSKIALQNKTKINHTQKYCC